MASEAAPAAEERRDDLGGFLSLDAAAIASMEWEPLRDPGVWLKVLWRAGDVVIGLVRVDAGVTKPAHVHFSAYHHIWVVSGRCTMAGRLLPAGSYAFIPAGSEHDVANVGPEGVEYFYTYRPVDHRLAEAQIAGAAASADD